MFSSGSASVVPAEVIKILGRGWSFPIGTNATGSIATSEGAHDIEEAIYMILSTPKRTRVLRPEFGCRIHELIFDPINIITNVKAAYYVREALHWWEPRIEVLDVEAWADPDYDGCMQIYIEYEIHTTHERRSLVYPFYTIPDRE